MDALRSSLLADFEHGFGTRESRVPEGVRIPNQVHGARVLPHEDCPTGEECDGLISRVAGGVGVRTADCVPILLAHPESGHVAAVHSGWRGTAQRIAAEAVRALGHGQGVLASLGPSIDRCCYEVSQEVIDALAATVDRPLDPALGEGRRVDLRWVIAEQLRACGVESIEGVGGCTGCGGDFFSHRVRRDKGRQVSWIFPKRPAAVEVSP